MQTPSLPKGVYPEEWHPAETLNPKVIKNHYDRSSDHSEVAKAWHLLDMAFSTHSKDEQQGEALFTGAFNTFQGSITSIERQHEKLSMKDRQRYHLGGDYEYLSSLTATAYRPDFEARLKKREITKEEMWQIHTATLPIATLALSLSRNKEYPQQAARVRHLIGSELITRAYDYTGYLPHLSSYRERKGNYQSFIKSPDDDRTLRMHFAPDINPVPRGVLAIPIADIALSEWRKLRHVDNKLAVLKLTHTAIKTEATLGQHSEILEQMTQTCIGLINDSWEDLLQ